MPIPPFANPRLIRSSVCSRLSRPARKPCDTEGCTKVSVRGTKCKAHAAPSKICVVEGCRKNAAVGGLCKKHQYGEIDPQAFPMGMGGVPMCQTIIVPAPAMVPQMAYPSQGQMQMVPVQNMALSGMGMGTNVRLVAPSISNYGGASMGMGGGMRFYPSNRAADMLAMSRMSSKQQPRVDSFTMSTMMPRPNFFGQP